MKSPSIHINQFYFLSQTSKQGKRERENLYLATRQWKFNLLNQFSSQETPSKRVGKMSRCILKFLENYHPLYHHIHTGKFMRCFYVSKINSVIYLFRSMLFLNEFSIFFLSPYSFIHSV